MKNLLKCSSLIRVAVLMVVMVFMASQMTGAYADKPHKHKGKPHKKIKLDEHDTDIKEAIEQHDTDAYNNIVTHDDNMTREHRSLSNQHGGLEEKLDEILEAVQNGGGDCPDAPVEKTGQTTSYQAGDDGDLQRGVAWPASPDTRFTDNGDGTITDNQTHLIWDKNANRFDGTGFGIPWSDACTACNELDETDDVNLTDGSVEGDWRLANVKEYQSLFHYGVSGPAVPDTPGTGQWSQGDPFNNVQSAFYWSSTTYADNTGNAWSVFFSDGSVSSSLGKGGSIHVWCVRGGQ